MREIEIQNGIYNKLKGEFRSMMTRSTSMRSKQFLVTGSTDFLELLIQKLGLMFSEPECSIINQFDYGEAVFFILQGDCIVNMMDYQN